MEWIFKFNLFAHIGFGSIGLLLFWGPMISKKGSQLHKRLGAIYSVSMWMVVYSGFGMLAIHVVDPTLGLNAGQDAERVAASRQQFFAFFILLIAIVAFNLSQGKLSTTADKTRMRGFFHSALLALMALSASVNLYLGLNQMHPLLIGFGVLGLVGSYDACNKIWVEFDSTNWLHEHISSFIGTGIGAYTGFFVFGARELIELQLSGYLALIPWVFPTIIGLYLTRRWTKPKRAISRVTQ